MFTSSEMSQIKWFIEHGIDKYPKTVRKLQNHCLKISEELVIYKSLLLVGFGHFSHSLLKTRRRNVPDDFNTLINRSYGTCGMYLMSRGFRKPTLIEIVIY